MHGPETGIIPLLDEIGRDRLRQNTSRRPPSWKPSQYHFREQKENVRLFVCLSWTKPANTFYCKIKFHCLFTPSQAKTKFAHDANVTMFGLQLFFQSVASILVGILLMEEVAVHGMATSITANTVPSRFSSKAAVWDHLQGHFSFGSLWTHSRNFRANARQCNQMHIHSEVMHQAQKDNI